MYKVKLEVFEGPFDLLYHLIQKNEIDICDVSLAQITEEYLEYIRAMQVLDLNLAGEFLVLAVALVELKVKTLMPKPVSALLEEDDSYDFQQDLVARLLEYKKFKDVSEKLRDKELDEQRIYRRLMDEVVEYAKTPDLNDTMPVEELWKAFVEILNKVEVKREDKNGVLEIGPEEFNVEEKMEYIQEMLGKKKRIYFKQLFCRQVHKLEIIVTFLALLELVRLSSIKVLQDAVFGRIIIQLPGLESTPNED